MPLQFYKPNKFNTGSACSFSINSKGGCIYAEIVNQISWDEKSETASFFNRQTSEKGVNVQVQLGRDEIGALIYAITSRKEWKNFHESEKQTTNIGFGLLRKWNKEAKVYEGDPIGYSFTISRKSKETNDSQNFKIGFTFGEAMVLLEFFRFSLEKIFSAIYAEDKKKAEDRLKAQG